ncbi:F-box domain-containing protein [Mycena venus]|uniref:F-box domain-containing protein n=1 Tax=Mycena venus TaxID=2733690 RepID=A0A8H6XCY2_9AGAR|nr:F-box domain-containing protein [Mycena venus]
MEEENGPAQPQLDAIPDPVARLPLELSSEIFLQCLPTRPKPGSHTAPMLLVNVCRAWTDTALATPMHCGPPSISIFRAKKSYDFGLHVRVLARCPSPFGSAWTMASPPSFGSMPNRFSALNCARESTTSAPWYPSPHLHTLTIASPLDDFTSPVDDFTSPEDDYMSETYIFNFAYIIGLLHLTPNLVECTFHGIRIYPPQTAPPPLVLPHLRYLKFVGRERTNVSDHVLSVLSLPALETLDNPLYYYYDLEDPSVNEFSRFLRRSSPPLQRLSLGRRYVNFPFPQLEAWLRLIPSVIDLELYTMTSIFANPLLSALADPPPIYCQTSRV